MCAWLLPNCSISMLHVLAFIRPGKMAVPISVPEHRTSANRTIHLTQSPYLNILEPFTSSPALMRAASVPAVSQIPVSAAKIIYLPLQGPFLSF